MASSTGLELLFSIRKSSAYNILYDVPDSFFSGADELNALTFMRDYVRTHNKFPSYRILRRDTGLKKTEVTEPVSYYLDAARKKALYRLVIGRMPEISDTLETFDPDSSIEEMQRTIADSSSINYNNATSLDIGHLADRVVENSRNALWTEGIAGVTTGWPELDAQTQGHRRGDLNTFVARLGVGKTYILLKQAHAAWEAGRSVVFLSMEMPAEEITTRLIGIDSGIDPRMIESGEITTRAMPRFLRSVERLKDRRTIHIIDTNKIKNTSSIIPLVEQYSADIVYLDSAYLIHPGQRHNARWEMVSRAQEEIKAISLDLNIPIVQTMQLNRDAVKGKRKQDNAQDNPGDRNPLSHLGMDMVADTDVIGRVSSLVCVAEVFDRPFARTRRWLGIIKGRSGASGYWAMNYSFTPVNFDIIPWQQLRRQNTNANLDRMI